MTPTSGSGMMLASSPHRWGLSYSINPFSSKCESFFPPILTHIPLPQSPPPISSSELPKAPGFAESCIIQQRLSLGRLQAPVTVIPVRMQSQAASPCWGLIPCSGGAQGGSRGTQHIWGSQPCTPQDWGQSQPGFTSSGMGQLHSRTWGYREGLREVPGGVGDPRGISWLLATTLNF